MLSSSATVLSPNGRDTNDLDQPIAVRISDLSYVYPDGHIALAPHVGDDPPHIFGGAWVLADAGAAAQDRPPSFVGADDA